MTVSGPGQNASVSRARDIGHALRECQRVGRVGDMHDERVIGGPALAIEDRGDSGVVVGTGTQPVDRFSRKGHELTCSQRVCGTVDRSGVTTSQQHGSECLDAQQ